MKIYILLVFLSFVAANLFATEAEILNILIPEKLKPLVLKKSTRIEVQKIWGKPDLVEKNCDYYIKEGIKYPVSFSYDQSDKLIKIYYRFVSEKPIKLEQVKMIFGPKGVAPVTEDPQNKNEFFLVNMPEKHLVLKFRQSEHQLLDTLIME